LQRVHRLEGITDWDRSDTLTRYVPTTLCSLLKPWARKRRECKRCSIKECYDRVLYDGNGPLLAESPHLHRQKHGKESYSEKQREPETKNRHGEVERTVTREERLEDELVVTLFSTSLDTNPMSLSRADILWNV
jgi:hypothetical protein